MNSNEIVDYFERFLPLDEEGTIRTCYLPAVNGATPWVLLKANKYQWTVENPPDGLTRLKRSAEGDWKWIA